MLRADDLSDKTDDELLSLVQKLDILCSEMGAGPTSNGRRMQQDALNELARRRNSRQVYKATVREET